MTSPIEPTAELAARDKHSWVVYLGVGVGVVGATWVASGTQAWWGSQQSPAQPDVYVGQAPSLFFLGVVVGFFGWWLTAQGDFVSRSLTSAVRLIGSIGWILLGLALLQPIALVKVFQMDILTNEQARRYLLKYNGSLALFGLMLGLAALAASTRLDR
ncbi:MAG TPA: hypothetical protein VMT88_13475 [Actinomycetes bacterium]|nr:hypothetical protein [Actinomycetes bacterium]